MKNVIKKFIICFICCTLFCISTSFQIPAEAKVIEPKIVKTEIWTTKYSVGHNTFSGDGLYGPYECKCLCDVYSDGCIYVYIQYDNLPKGDVHIYLEECVPIKSSGCFKYSHGTGRNFSVVKVLGDNFYPDYYNIEYNGFVRFDSDGSDSNCNYMFFYTEPTEYIEGLGSYRSDCFPYANIITDTNKPETTFKFDTRTTNT